MVVAILFEDRNHGNKTIFDFSPKICEFPVSLGSHSIKLVYDKTIFVSHDSGSKQALSYDT